MLLCVFVVFVRLIPDDIFSLNLAPFQPRTMRFIQPVSLFTAKNPNLNNNHGGDTANSSDPIGTDSSSNGNQLPVAWTNTGTVTSPDPSHRNNLNRAHRQPPYTQLGHHRQTEVALGDGERINIIDADDTNVSVCITSADAVSFTKHSPIATSTAGANVSDSNISTSVTHPEINENGNELVDISRNGNSQLVSRSIDC